MAQFTGKWEIECSENFGEYMSAIGKSSVFLIKFDTFMFNLKGIQRFIHSSDLLVISIDALKNEGQHNIIVLKLYSFQGGCNAGC